MKTQWHRQAREVWIVQETIWDDANPAVSIEGVFADREVAERHAKKGQTVAHFIYEGTYVPNGLRRTDT